MLYCDRRHLDDFGVENKNSLNHFIEKRLFERYSHLPNYEDLATFSLFLFGFSIIICIFAHR